MNPDKNILFPDNTPTSRRCFLSKSLKLAALSTLLLPLQKALGNGSSFIIHQAEKLEHGIRKVIFSDKLILNLKTKVVHLPTKKIFTHYPEIAAKNQKIIDLKSWETQLKTPVHFHKEKSGIILEMLALQKLVAGINDKSLAAAANTLAIAFSPVYNNKSGNIVSKYNFRIHDLLLQTITLNNRIPVVEKWNRFQLATGKIYYHPGDKLPGRMGWLKSKTEFDNKAAYIIKNKIKYMGRLKKRAIDHKL